MVVFIHEEVVPYKHIFRSSEPINLDVNQFKILLGELTEWATKTLIGKWTWEFDNFSNFYFKIQDDHDAIMFKLRWGGNEQ